MASDVPPAAEQLKTLLAHYNKRLMWRLTAWGAAAAVSLAVVVIVSQTGSGHKRLRTALFGPGQPYQVPASVASTTVAMPPADLIAVKRSTEAMRQTTEAVKRATDRTVARLEAVERNTAETRAETRRLAQQVSKLGADSIRVAGRIANIETQVGSITGSIKDMTGSIRTQAEEAAAAAVARAMPPRTAFDTKAADLTAPLIRPPATAFPKLSLIVPQANDTDRKDQNSAGEAGADVTITSSITATKTESKDQSRVSSRLRGKAEPETGQLTKASSKPEELKAGVGVETRAAHGTSRQIALKPQADGKPMAKPEEKAERKVAEKTVTGSIPARRRAPSQYWIPTSGYGVDLGGAESVSVAKAQWAAVKANFGPVLGGMRPLVVRNHRLLTTGEYRLVAGRTRSLASAEKLCKRLALQRMTCQPVEFDDGRMVWR